MQAKCTRFELLEKLADESEQHQLALFHCANLLPRLVGTLAQAEAVSLSPESQPPSHTPYLEGLVLGYNVFTVSKLYFQGSGFTAFALECF